MKHRHFRNATAILAMALTAACGGGSSSAPPSGGISGTGFAVGIITGFGSIIVNGQHYGTTTATITSDGMSINQGQLKIGDYVVVAADINDDGSRDARSIELDEAVEGVVFSVTPEPLDPRVGDLNVMGHLVHVSANTGLDNFTGLDQLAAADCVEVYGLVIDSSGAIDASRIEKKAVCDGIEVKGFIDSANTGAKTFVISGLTVDYSSAQLMNFGNGEPSAGMFVEVKGPLADVDIVAASMLASMVEARAQGINDDISDDDEAEVEGYVSGCTMGNCASFTVSGVPVRIDSNTMFDPDTMGQAQMMDGIRVEVEGVFSGGELIASSLNMHAREDVRIEALVDEVSTDAIYLLGGSGSGNGIMVSITMMTRMELDGTNLVAGDYALVSGQESPADSNMVVATRIERKSPNPDTLLQGVVDTKTASAVGYDLSILGKTVSVPTAAGATKCEGLDDQTLDCSILVDSIVAGQTVVKAKGSWDANSMVLDTASGEVSLEN
ncbi:MAG: DUF5666 domain-containing protein [Gammaproteobacteria bacterium]|nr:DUF5666 domain-containing protein [Gammaproteobacteria bacterium]